ncbi:hypothetical protein FACS189472_10870 [Alphaproteobacteria bacterium]|nr:hypothetical protein FACS189472_10870 [Alphaproteobacteria bacterium]
MKYFAVFSAVLYCSVSFGMKIEPAFESYVHEWSAKLTAPAEESWGNINYNEFKTDLFKEKLLQETTNDPLCAGALELFFLQDFAGFLAYWEKEGAHMLLDNKKKCEELLILVAPVIYYNAINKPFVDRIKQLVGGAKEILSYEARFPQFSYEALFCIMVDAENGTPRKALLAKACEKRCEEIMECSPDWRLKKAEFNLMRIMPLCEDFGQLKGFHRLGIEARQHDLCEG